MSIGKVVIRRPARSYDGTFEILKFLDKHPPFEIGDIIDIPAEYNNYSTEDTTGEIKYILSVSSLNEPLFLLEVNGIDTGHNHYAHLVGDSRLMGFTSRNIELLMSPNDISWWNRNVTK